MRCAVTVPDAEKSSVLGVLEEDPVDLGRIAIGARDDGLAIIDHEPADHALKEGPGRLQPRKDRGQVLARSATHRKAYRMKASVTRSPYTVRRAPVAGSGHRPNARSRLRRPRRPAARRPAR
jgi:hypothetical protein